MSRTTREIAWRMDALNSRKANDVELQANLHGVKFKSSKAPKANVKQLDDKRQEKLDKLIANKIKKGRL